MKFKYKITKLVEGQPDVWERKINDYLIKNSYRITERGPGYMIFVEDDYSDRRRARSDFHRRIGEGKFTFDRSSDNETSIQLIYLTSVTYYIFLLISVGGFGVYTKNVIMPVVFTIALTMPILLKIFYMNEHVFQEIKEC